MDVLLKEKHEKKIRFESCLNSLHKIQYVGALQDHSGGVRVDPTLQINAEIPYGWTDYIYHVGSSGDRRSIVDTDFLAGGTSGNQGRHTCFFIVVDLLSESDVGPSCDIGRPRIVPYKSCGHGITTLFCWFDLKIAQNERVVFRQTMSNAVILNYTIPADCLIKSGTRNIVPQNPSEPQKPPKVNLRPN